MMSANITAASTPCTRTGSSVTSAHSSGCRQTSNSAVPLADLAVPGQRATGLAHEPDGRPLDGLEASRSDQQRGHYNWAASWSSIRRKTSDATASATRSRRRTRRRRRRAAAARPKKSGSRIADHDRRDRVPVVEDVGQLRVVARCPASGRRCRRSGVRMNHGSSIVASRCSMSRKMTVAEASTIAKPVDERDSGIEERQRRPERRPRLGDEQQVERQRRPRA